MLTVPLLVNLNRVSFDNLLVDITIAQVEDQVPFTIKRVYWLRSGSIPSMRGNHAHINAYQFLTIIQGEVILHITNQQGEKQQYFLNNSPTGLVVPPKHWLEIEMEQDTVLLCFSSKLFEEQITEYDFSNFLKTT